MKRAFFRSKLIASLLGSLGTAGLMVAMEATAQVPKPVLVQQASPARAVPAAPPPKQRVIVVVKKRYITVPARLGAVPRAVTRKVSTSGAVVVAPQAAPPPPPPPATTTTSGSQPR